MEWNVKIVNDIKSIYKYKVYYIVCSAIHRSNSRNRTIYSLYSTCIFVKTQVEMIKWMWILQVNCRFDLYVIERRSHTDRSLCWLLYRNLNTKHNGRSPHRIGRCDGGISFIFREEEHILGEGSLKKEWLFIQVMKGKYIRNEYIL